AADRARPPLPVAEPGIGPARRRDRRVGARGPGAPPPGARARPPPSPPSPRPRPRGRAWLPLAPRRRRLGRPAPLPVRARRAARGDLAAPRRVRALADRRIQRRA